jgi:RNA polymerase sigma-70 factor (ECF subfamily)
MDGRLDPVAFEALVRAHSAAAFRAAQRIAGDDALALDAVQEVFLAVLDGRLNPREARDPDALLRSRAVHAALARRRGDARRRAREAHHAMQQEHTHDAAAPVERADEAQSLWEQLTRVPEELRLALLLRFREGYSYATIGRELGCAEPTAHDRVRRGLERLRALLGAAGLAALAVDVEQRLALADPPGPLPAGLDARLLELSRASAVTLAGSGVSPLLAVGLVLGASVAAFVAPRLATGQASGAVEALQPGAGAPVAQAPPAEDAAQDRGAGARKEVRPARADDERPQDAPEPPPTGRVTGRVVDRAGGPVPGATVHLSTVERQGKFPLWGADTKTDVNGLFALDVPVPEAGGRKLRVDVGRLGFTARVADARAVVAGRETRLGDVVLDLLDLARAGSFELDVEVRGADGMPLQGAYVSLHHQVPVEGVRIDPTVSIANRSWERGWHRLQDDAGRTLPGGVVTLRGERLGGKVLLVKPGDPAWAPAEIELPIDTAGAHARVVTLEPGRSIEGRVTDLEGRPVAGVRLNLVARAHPNRDWLSPKVEDGGGFRCAGLARGAYELRVEAPGRSPARKLLEAGERDVVVLLKADDDARDVGDHAAEIHGRLVDAASGEAVTFEPPWEVGTFWFPEPAGRDVERDVLPNHLLMPPVQRAARMEMPEDPPPSSAFHLTGLGAGPTIVYVDRSGYAPACAGPFLLAEDTLVADVEVPLHAPVTLRTRVLGLDGDPLEGALVFVTGEGPYSDERVAEANAAYRAAGGRGSVYDSSARRTAADGRASHARLPVGRRVVLVAIHPDHEPVRSAPVVLGSEEAGAELELRFRARR